MNFVSADPLDVDDDASVVEQQGVPRRDIARQIGVVEADPLLVALRAGGVEDEAVAGMEVDLAGGELADADLRSLQIGQNAYRAPESGRKFADAFRQRDVIGGCAVREIEPEDIDP